MSFILELLVAGICLGGLYALVAIGYSLIYGVLKLINFAHGEFFACGAYCAYLSSVHLGLPFPATLIAGTAGGAVIAWAVERWAYRPVGHTSNLLLLVTSIGISVVLRNLLSILFGDQFRTLRTGAGACYVDIGISRIVCEQVYILAGLLLMGILLWVLIWKMRFGLRIRAVANNREAATVGGVNVQNVITSAFVIGGAYAGLAGVFAGMLTELTPQMGSLMGIKAFTAAVVGGIGNITGSIFAGLLLGILEALAIGFLGTQYRDTYVFVILLIALLLRPEGLISPLKKAA
jgi:branched-chain amino acid transport system permease protein